MERRGTRKTRSREKKNISQICPLRKLKFNLKFGVVHLDCVLVEVVVLLLVRWRKAFRFRPRVGKPLGYRLHRLLGWQSGHLLGNVLLVPVEEQHHLRIRRVGSATGTGEETPNGAEVPLEDGRRRRHGEQNPSSACHVRVDRLPPLRPENEQVPHRVVIHTCAFEALLEVVEPMLANLVLRIYVEDTPSFSEQLPTSIGTSIRSTKAPRPCTLTLFIIPISYRMFSCVDDILYAQPITLT